MSDSGRSSSGPQEWDVLRMLEWATSYFESKGVTNPRLSIEWLLGEVLGLKRLDLYLKHDRPLSSAELDLLRPWVARRARHEPLQYILGYAEFYGRRFEVNSSVLVPRPETEQLVELVLENHDENPITVVDFGTGSGCIAITLKKERPNWTAIGVDLSPEALAVASQNASGNNADVEWLLGDMRKPSEVLQGRRVDVVVSNPPYVLPEERRGLDREVVDYEPHLALFDDDPAQLYSILADFAEQQGSSARFYAEIHSDQGPQVLDRLKRVHRDIMILKDYSGKERMLSLRFGLEVL